MESADNIVDFCLEDGIKVARNVKMSGYTSFNTGGTVSVIAFPGNVKQISDLIIQANKERIRYHIIGKGSNILASDDGTKDLIILLGSDFSNIELIGQNIIKVQAGATLASVCKYALNNSLTGLEFGWGIPGTIGGAVFMNAGAYDGEMGKVVIKAQHIDDKGQEGEFSHQELSFAYRSSAYSNLNYCITGAYIELEKGEKSEIKKKMDDFMARRKSKQPLEYPSAGSVFKRPPGHFAGALIQECGLKGKTIGGAQVSEKHAGFIINVGQAKTQDVLDLIDFVKKEVFKKFKIKLECEVSRKFF